MSRRSSTPIRDKAQDLLWPENQDEARWSDVVDRYAEQAGMPWLPPKGLDTLKSIACNRGLWEDLGNGYVTKKPKKKTTSAQVIAEPEPDDEGKVRLRINSAERRPRAAHLLRRGRPGHRGEPTAQGQTLHHHRAAGELPGRAIRPASTRPAIRSPGPTSSSCATSSSRKAASAASNSSSRPRASIRYTLDGSEPREGTPTTGPIAIGDGEVLLRAFAEADGLEAKTEFRFPAKGKKGVQIDDVKPARLVSRTGRKLDSRAQDLRGSEAGRREVRHIRRRRPHRGPGQPDDRRQRGEIPVNAAFIEALLNKVLEKFAPDTPVTMTFRKAHFASGHDLKDFAEKLGIELQPGDVEQ